MARLPRLVLPGYPYHVTQRGNRRQPTFFDDGDYLLYRDLRCAGGGASGSRPIRRLRRLLGAPADYTEAWRMLRKAETTRRPIGAAAWIGEIERRTGRALVPQKRGPKSGI